MLDGTFIKLIAHWIEDVIFRWLKSVIVWSVFSYYIVCKFCTLITFCRVLASVLTFVGLFRLFFDFYVKSANFKLKCWIQSCYLLLCSQSRIYLLTLSTNLNHFHHKTIVMLSIQIKLPKLVCKSQSNNMLR